MATGLLSAVKGLGIRTTRFPHPPGSNPFEREITGVCVYAGIVCVGTSRLSMPSAILDRNPIGCLGVITPTAMNSGTAQVFQPSGTGSVAPDENPVKDKPCGWLHTSPLRLRILEQLCMQPLLSVHCPGAVFFDSVTVYSESIPAYVDSIPV